MSMLDGTSTLMPDGSLVIPREEYLGAVALLKWDACRPDDTPSAFTDFKLESLQAIVTACERLGMPQATYQEVDLYLQAIAEGELERADEGEDWKRGDGG